MHLFPISHYWPFYIGFTVFVFLVLLLDLGLFHRKAHEVSFKEASIWTVVWITLALIFNVLFYFYAKWRFTVAPYLVNIAGFDADAAAKQSAIEFLTGYVVEKSLAIDNLFVFAVIFAHFAIPKKYQHRILFYGIIGALVFRAIFIALGSVLMEYHYVVIFFGVLLIFTGIKMVFSQTHVEDVEKSIVIRILKKLFRIHPKLEEDKFFIKKNGLRYATPMFVTLIFIEFSDIIFSVDSVPAIFAITKEPLIVFTSNIFAILGLRSMYFMLVGTMDKFRFIKYGLAAVLVFVGAKMVYLNTLFGGKFPASLSLVIIASLIGSSVVASLLVDRREPNRR